MCYSITIRPDLYRLGIEALGGTSEAACKTLSPDKENKMITQSRLKELLHYNPATGLFTWKKPNSNRVKIGDIAGVVMKKGYIIIGIDGKRAYAHRLAWIYMYGETPNIVDHINRDKKDNRRLNLRNTNRSGNACNSKLRTDNKTGFVGVTYSKITKKWMAQIVLNKEHYTLGYFFNIKDAIKARKDAEESLKAGVHYIHDNKVIYSAKDKTKSISNKSGYKNVYAKANGYEVSFALKYYGRYKKLEDAVEKANKVRMGLV